MTAKAPISDTGTSIIGSTIARFTPRTFFVALSSPSRATITGSGVGTGTILDANRLPTIAINNVTVVETSGQTGVAVFTVTLSAANYNDVSIQYATSDGTATAPYREYDPACPRSVYGATKWAGEQAIREVNPRHIIVRTSWLYGRGGPNFIDTILSKARAGEPLKVVNDQRGSPTYTVDLAAALVALASTSQYGTYHVTNSGDCTWFDLARHVVDRTGLRVALDPTDTASFARPAPLEHGFTQPE